VLIVQPTISFVIEQAITIQLLNAFNQHSALF